ncbi:MAG: hypothetical protein KME43_24115 [Myxacorys chilensis ATA2-1-KO14]|jgi:hypothetical protein|nr:hypothetical protein [Myxacorys chilensis ATA2-1-KO14]
MLTTGESAGGSRGGIDICIDGLNEVTADTRAKITQFVESYFKGNIIMTTQPLEWMLPSTAKVYQLQPLRNDQIETFLLSRKNSIDLISNSNVPSKSENIPLKNRNAPSESENVPTEDRNVPSKNESAGISLSNYPEFCCYEFVLHLHSVTHSTSDSLYFILH